MAIRLARKFNGEIISADSRQVYQGMDIGTGKVTKAEQRLAKHWLIDVADPKRQFSVSQFKSRAKRAIADINKRGKLPILCGGTGLYIDALVYDLDLPEVPPNPKLRSKLEKQTAEQLFAQLKKLDRGRAKTIDSKNKRRLIRAIEIATAIGRIPHLDTDYSKHKPKYEVLWLGLNPKNLNQRIEKRLTDRLQNGMTAEIKKLHMNCVSWRRLNDFGLEYRWLSEYLQKNISRAEMAAGLLKAIEHYAKRQMTWFKRNKNIRWLADASDAMRLSRDFLRSSPRLP